jgi:hypothetical protein
LVKRDLGDLALLEVNPVEEVDLIAAEHISLALSATAENIPSDGICGSLGYSFWAINKVPWSGDTPDPTAPLAELKFGRSYVIDMENLTPQSHPMHLRGMSFKVLSSSTRPVQPIISDTYLIQPNEKVQLGFVADNPGDWLLHCHIIEHQKSGDELCSSGLKRVGSCIFQSASQGIRLVFVIPGDSGDLRADHSEDPLEGMLQCAVLLTCLIREGSQRQIKLAERFQRTAASPEHRPGKEVETRIGGHSHYLQQVENHRLVVAPSGLLSHPCIGQSKATGPNHSGVMRMIEFSDDAVNHVAGTDQVEGTRLAPNLTEDHTRSAQFRLLAMQLADEIEGVEPSFAKQLNERADIATTIVVDNDLRTPKSCLHAFRECRVKLGQCENEMEWTIDRFQQHLEFGPELDVMQVNRDNDLRLGRGQAFRCLGWRTIKVPRQGFLQIITGGAKAPTAQRLEGKGQFAPF